MARELSHKIRQQLAPYLPGAERPALTLTTYSARRTREGAYIRASLAVFSFSFRVTFGLGLASSTVKVYDSALPHQVERSTSPPCS